MASGEAKVLVDPVAALPFEYSIPMLLIPFLRFKQQGRIYKSTKTWRDEALSKGWLVTYDKASGKIVIFISHTWWDREFTDETNDETDKYDRGAPDFQADYPDEKRAWMGGKTYEKPKDLKWRVICAGVEKLIEEQGLTTEAVMLWVDWQSIYQDDKEEKMKGVRSLIKYVPLSDYMLVPTEEEELMQFGLVTIPGYGSRGWCLVESFIFLLAAEMRGHEMQYKGKDRYGLRIHVPGTGVQLYGIQRDGSLRQYPKVVVNALSMPSRGALSNPNDKALVQDLEGVSTEGGDIMCVGEG